MARSASSSGEGWAAWPPELRSRAPSITGLVVRPPAHPGPWPALALGLIGHTDSASTLMRQMHVRPQDIRRVVAACLRGLIGVESIRTSADIPPLCHAFHDPGRRRKLFFRRVRGVQAFSLKLCVNERGNFVGHAQGVEHEQRAAWDQGCKTPAGLDHDVRNADLSGAIEHFPQKDISPFTARRGGQVMRCFEAGKRDFIDFNERENIDYVG
jgi:hypothetical protein